MISFGALVLLALAQQARAATLVGSQATDVWRPKEAAQFARLSVRNAAGNPDGVRRGALVSCGTGRVI
jgi:hypothetical protein